jgi:hypothetical protein
LAWSPDGGRRLERFSRGRSVMEKETRPKVLLYQSAGFIAIIGLCWLDEALGLSKLILGNHSFLPEFRMSTLEMLLVLAVWLLVSTSTRRVLEHARRLERFMRLCAWCHRVEYKGDWIHLEEFLEKGFDTPTTHGICQICLAREKAAAERARSSPPLTGEQPVA